MEETENARYIGIRHRVKRTAAGEARPTQLVIVAGGKTVILALDDEDAELDFVRGRFPIGWREPAENEDLSAIPARHRKTKKVGGVEKMVKVPASYDGLRHNDVVAMVLGGSGDRFAFALSRQSDAVGARVARITSFDLKRERGDGDKDDDAALLARLVAEKPGLFRPVDARERDLVMVRETLRAREDAMLERIACEQRLRQRLIGAAFCSQTGGYPEGSLEDAFEARKADDVILQALLKEEKQREKEAVKAIERIPVYEKVLSPIKGCGPMIASRLVAAIGDVRRFRSPAALKAFCGVHVLPDGGFARKRRGTQCNWNPTARQALWLLGDQFNRRPDSSWGAKLLEYKAKFRAKHPEIVIEGGKKRYTNGHIHQMAIWRTVTKFVERFWKDWMKLENGSTTNVTSLSKPRVAAATLMEATASA